MTYKLLSKKEEFIATKIVDAASTVHNHPKNQPLRLKGTKKV